MASNITSKKIFVEKFPNVKLDRSVTDPTVSSAMKSRSLLDYDVLVDWLSGDMGSQLKLTQYIIDLMHEKSRYFLVYEVLKSFAKYSQGTLLLQLREQLDEDADSDDLGLLKQGQTINFERRIPGTHRVAATIECVVVNREDPDDILLTVEVKDNITSEAHLWQTLAELINASSHKGSGARASLTDAFSWRFFEAKRDDKGWVVSASRSFAMFDADLNGVSTTNHVFSLLYSCLFPDQQFPSQSQFHDVNEAAERAMKKNASVLAAGSRDVSAAEIARLSAVNDELMKENQELKKQRRT